MDGPTEATGDRERVAVVHAERELDTLQVIVDYAGISPLARRRAHEALAAIRRGLVSWRVALGLAARDAGHGG
jgi:hypothetical protein